VNDDDYAPYQHLNDQQFADWIGPLGSFGDPAPAPSGGTYPGTSTWTASSGY
jgi:hypothetical protein